MLTITIQDEATAQRLREQATREGRTPDDIATELLKQQHTAEREARRLAYETWTDPDPIPDDADERRAYMRRRIYDRARRRWAELGDTVNAALTNDELDERFGGFDANGIPRFKGDLPEEPALGSARSLAMAAKRLAVRGLPTDARRADDLVADAFEERLNANENGDDHAE